MSITGSCRIHRLTLRPACLIPVSPCRLISSVIASLAVSPFFDTVGRGVRRGASVLSAYLVFALRFLPMSISRSIPLSLRRLLGLFACRLGCGGTVFSSRRAGCVAMSCLSIGPSRLSPRLSSRRSVRLVSSLAPFLDTMGGASAVAVRLRRAFVPHPDFLPPVSSPCACLPWVVPAL